MSPTEFDARVLAMRKAAEATILVALQVLEGAPRTDVWRVTVRDRQGYRVWTIQGGLLDVLSAYERSASGYGGAGEIVSIVKEGKA